MQQQVTRILRLPSHPLISCTCLVLVASALLSSGAGCASYTTFGLKPLKPGFHHSVIRVGDVAACMEQLDAVTSKRYFGKDLRAAGYQAIQFTIANDSTEYIELHLSQISVPGAEPQTVAEKCHFNTAGRATGYGVAGIFIWPLLIPAIVDGTGSAKANGQMDIDFAAKALEDQVIVPYGKANGVLYVPNEQLNLDITMRLIRKDNNEILLFRWSDGQPVEGIMQERTVSTAGETVGHTWAR